MALLAAAAGVYFAWRPGLPSLCVAAGVAFCVVCGFFSWLSWCRRRTRGTEVMQAAALMGFSYAARREAKSTFSAFAEFRFFSEVESDGLLNWVEGQIGEQRIAVADWYTRWASPKQDVRQTVAFVKIDDEAPDFRLAPAGLLDRLLPAGIGSRFALDGEHRLAGYRFNAPDEDAVRRRFQAEAASWFTASDWHVEAKGGSLMLFRFNHLASAAKLPDFAAEAVRLANSLRAGGPAGAPTQSSSGC